MMDPRLPRMVAMRLEGKILQEIGDCFGLTKERVRQLLCSMPRPPKPKPWPKAYFERVMRKWLWDAGFRRCSKCKLWSSEVTRTLKRCRTCNQQYVRDYYAKSESYREACKKHVQEQVKSGYFDQYYRRPETARRIAEREARRRASRNLRSS